MAALRFKLDSNTDFLDNTTKMHRKDANTQRKLANSVKKHAPQRHQKKLVLP
jgi:hypothetical protein